MGQVLPHLYMKQQDGLPSDIMANTKKRVECGLESCHNVTLGASWKATQDPFIHNFIFFINNGTLIVFDKVWQVF